MGFCYSASGRTFLFTVVDTQDKIPLPSCRASHWTGSEGITHLCFIAGELWPQGKAWPSVWLSVYNASQSRSGWRRGTLRRAGLLPSLCCPGLSILFKCLLTQTKGSSASGGKRESSFPNLEAVAWCGAHPLLRPPWELRTQLSSFWGSSLWLLRR